MISNDEMLERHKKMLAYQEKIKPFTPTIRELGKVWNLTSTSVFYNLRQLLGMGLVTVRNGHYFAIKADSPAVESGAIQSDGQP